MLGKDWELTGEATAFQLLELRKEVDSSDGYENVVWEYARDNAGWSSDESIEDIARRSESA